MGLQKKLNKNGGIDKYKAQLLAKVIKKKGINYKEVFALVARLDTMQLVLCIAAQNSRFIYQLDGKSTFLHGKLQEEVYIEWPTGFVKPGHEGI